MDKAKQQLPAPLPPGYPTTTTDDQNPPIGKKKKWFSRSKPKGDRGFIEGCLFALCCCWICEMCF